MDIEKYMKYRVRREQNLQSLKQVFENNSMQIYD